MSPRIRAHAKAIVAIVGLVLAAAAVSGYVLSHQRLRFPLIEKAPFEIEAEFSTAQAVTPGQGQTVRVSGVRIGDISHVALREGRAVITLALDPEYRGLVRSDARAMLRPRTGLKDMFVELTPGSSAAPALHEHDVIPIASTLPDVNLDEVLSTLDADVREHLLQLVTGAGQGLDRRGDDLGALLARFQPTHRDLRRVGSAVAARRADLRRLSRSLRLVSEELAHHSRELPGLVRDASATFAQLAAEQRSLGEGIARLPGTLRETRAALASVGALADELRTASPRLTPAAKELEPASAAITPLAREGTPIVSSQLRPAVRAARPVARALQSPAVSAAGAAEPLAGTLTVLNHLLNMAAFNPRGREPADKANREEGYLFWAAWLDHNGGALHSTADAHGPLRPLTESGDCSSILALAEQEGLGDAVAGVGALGLEGVFTDPRVCGSTLATDPAFARRLIGARRARALADGGGR